MIKPNKLKPFPSPCLNDLSLSELNRILDQEILFMRDKEERRSKIGVGI